MPRSRYVVLSDHQPHFVTCTVHDWLPVFTRPDVVDIVLDSWRFLQADRQFLLYGYVVMVNHLHFIGASPAMTKTLSQFKSFTARKILSVLRESGVHPLVKQLVGTRSRTGGRRQGKLWRAGSHPQQILDEEMLVQKLTYMHLNPVQRGYVDDPLHWRYSSARNYEGLEGLVQVQTDWRT